MGCRWDTVKNNSLKYIYILSSFYGMNERDRERGTETERNREFMLKKKHWQMNVNVQSMNMFKIFRKYLFDLVGP